MNDPETKPLKWKIVDESHDRPGFCCLAIREEETNRLIADLADEPVDVPYFVERAWEAAQTMVDAHNSKGNTERETFDGGAVRDATDYRYDLCSSVILDYLPDDHAGSIVANVMRGRYRESLASVMVVAGIGSPKMLHLYAQALHEGTQKYGERQWEKGLPESNLKNHALYHLIQWSFGDESEPHLSHAIWNLITLIHFYDNQESAS